MSVPPPPLSETSSRYTFVEKFTGAAAGSLAKPDDVAPAMVELRATFAKEKTLTYEWRMSQLKALRAMVVEGRDQLCEAMLADLHKSKFEGYATELSCVEAELDEAIAQLAEWMKPKGTGNSALNIPAWSTTQHDPLGVVLIMGAWNYPCQLLLTPLIGAIAGGNCAILKPGSYAPTCSHALSRLLQKSLDPAAFKVAEGDKTITEALLDERFDKICYTGSGFVGKIVLERAARHLTPCILELGGKSPCIIDRTAHLEHAARRVVWGAFVNNGQTCVRPDHLLIHAAVATKFVALLKVTIKEFYGEEPQKCEWLGRCINDNAFQRLEGVLRATSSHVCIGGKTDASDRFIEPTLLDYGTDMAAFAESAAMQDEIFGPILPMVTYTDAEQAIAHATRLPTGKPLALYAHTTDAAFVESLKRRTTSGALVINDVMMHAVNHELPFGGVGASGMGSYHGHRSFLAFTHEKAVLEKSPMLDESPALKPVLAARFPPYTPFKSTLIKTFGARPAGLAVNVHRYVSFWVVLAAYAAYAMGLRITWVGA